MTGLAGDPARPEWVAHMQLTKYLSEDGTLVGEITCDLLFKADIPDLLGQLKSIAFTQDALPQHQRERGSLARAPS